MKNESIVKRGEDTPWNIVDDEVVLLNLDSGHYYSLNESGRRVWELLDGENTIPDIINTICEEFDVEQQEAAKDINTLIDELLKEKLASTVP
jgi:trimethylamine:corrinoid methyltransferase-like protein